MMIPSQTLGFNIDWGSIATNLTRGALEYQKARNATKVQMAQLQRETEAQRRAMLPPPAYPPSAFHPGMLPDGRMMARPAPQAATLPAWVIPAGAAAAAVVLVMLLRR